MQNHEFVAISGYFTKFLNLKNAIWFGENFAHINQYQNFSNFVQLKLPQIHDSAAITKFGFSGDNK